jgi:hypothetical protein
MSAHPIDSRQRIRDGLPTSPLHSLHRGCTFLPTNTRVVTVEIIRIWCLWQTQIHKLEHWSGEGDFQAMLSFWRALFGSNIGHSEPVMEEEQSGEDKFWAQILSLR